MALSTLSEVSETLSQLFLATLQRQMNRHSVYLQLVPKKRGGGKNHSWAVQFSNNAAAAYSEGADISAADLTADTEKQALLSWSQYRSAFGVSGLAKATQATSPGSASEMLNAVRLRAVSAAQKLASVINGECYAGSSDIIGLDTALAPSGSYAGISKATYPEWAGIVNGSSGTNRALTKTLMDDHEMDIFKACGMAPDVIITTPEIAKAYEALFDATTRHIVQNGEIAAQSRSMGAPLVRDRSGFSGYSYKGIPVYRDKDATANQMYWLNLDHVAIVTVPPVGMGQTAVAADGTSLVDDMGNPVGLLAMTEALAKTGDSDRYQVKVYIQQEITRPNSHGILDDISQ